MKQFLLITLSFLLLSSCIRKHGDEVTQYWVVQNADSKNKNSKNEIPPPPPPPQELKWYTNIVFIMDSKNKVYVYQTETTHRYEFVKTRKTNFEPISEYKFPTFIGLKPEHLLTFDSTYFVKFLKENNDIFELVKITDQSKRRLIYLVSDCDTIKNPAFYEFGKLIEKEERLAYIVRKTTEEENQVLTFKRNQHKYVPKQINWSTNFINGKVKPFTEEYEILEEKLTILKKAKPTFDKGNLEYFAGCGNYSSL